MATRHFDDLTRALATGSTRRGFFRGLLGGTAAVVGLGAATTAVAHGQTVEICHKTWAWSTDWRIITVNANDTRRINAHLEHGDVIDPDYSSDPTHCGACGHTCEAPANATATCDGGTCGFTCNDGYESDGAGGCATIRNPAINVSFDPTSDENYCLIQVDLVEFAANTTYPVTLEAASSSTGPAYYSFPSSMITDNDGFATGYPIGSLVRSVNWVRVIANGITTAWYNIAC